MLLKRPLSGGCSALPESFRFSLNTQIKPEKTVYAHEEGCLCRQRVFRHQPQWHTDCQAQALSGNGFLPCWPPQGGAFYYVAPKKVNTHNIFSPGVQLNV